MKIRHWFVLGALACAPLAAIAQQAPAQQRPQDADAAVPALTYTSAFEGFSSSAGGEEPSPDKAWRPANDQVGNAPTGHSGHAPQEDAPPAKPPADAPPPQHQHKHEAHGHG